MLAAIAVPLIVALVSVSREKWYPTGDMAQAELHVRGFFRHPPLVGAAGRIGSPLVPYGQGSHPGPALWVALLPFYLVTGHASFGLELGMTVLQVAFLMATVIAVRRLVGPLGGLVVAVAGAALVHAMRPAAFIEPWNPWGALFAFFLFIALVWGVMRGRSRWLPATAFAGFFAVQCHVGYALLVGAGLVGAIVFVVRQWRRDANRREAFRTAGLTVAVTVVMWAPPLLDQVRRHPGNLSILWHHFLSSTNPDGTAREFVGLVPALKAFAGEFAVPGPWIRGSFREPSDAPNWVTFVVAAALVVTVAVVIMRRRDMEQRSDLVALFALLGGLCVVGIISTARIFGDFFEYVIRWWWIIVAWVFAACVLAVARLVGERGIRWVIAATLTFAVAMAALTTADAVGEHNPGPRNSRLVGGVAPLVAARLDHQPRYLVRWLDPATLGGVPFGVLLELEKRGFHVGVDAFFSAGALPHRVLPESSAGAVLWVILGQANIDMMRSRPDAVELGSFDQRSSAEVVESDSLREQLVSALDRHGLVCLVPTIDAQYGLAQFVLDTGRLPSDVSSLGSRYSALGLPVAVFELPPGAPPLERPPVAGC